MPWSMKVKDRKLPAVRKRKLAYRQELNMEKLKGFLQLGKVRYYFSNIDKEIKHSINTKQNILAKLIHKKKILDEVFFTIMISLPVRA